MKDHEFIMLVRIFCNEHKIKTMNEYFYWLDENKHLGSFLRRYLDAEHIDTISYIVRNSWLREFNR